MAIIFATIIATQEYVHCKGNFVACRHVTFSIKKKKKIIDQKRLEQMIIKLWPNAKHYKSVYMCVENIL